MKELKERFKEVLRLFVIYKVRVIGIFLILSMLLGSYHYMMNSYSCSATMSLNYSEASNGLNPNKTRFNSYEIISSEVLNNAIEACGLQGEITPEQLSECISVSPVDTGGASGSDYYISTTYWISFNSLNLKIKTRKAIDILNNICASYKAEFMDKYCDNLNILNLKINTAEDSEPYISIKELMLRVGQLKRYTNARLNENKSFVDSKSGGTFVEIDKALSNISNYDIPNAMAYIIENGVAKDPTVLTQILEYKNKIKSISADKALASYNADIDGINFYNSQMSSIVMVPTIDETDQYYMSRTKTAMDRLAQDADSSLKDCTDYRRDISDTQYVIDNINAKLKAKNKKNEATAEEICKEKLDYATSLVSGLEKKLNDISDKLSVVDSSYIEYKEKNYITFRSYEPSFIQRVDLKTTVIEIAVIYALTFVFFIFKTNTKKFKRKREEE